MKTFGEFIILAEDKMAERLGKMTDAEFEQFLKARQPAEVASFKAKRLQYRTTNVSGQNIRSGSQARTQTPPPGSQARTQTPPRQTSGGLATSPTRPTTPTGSGIRARLGRIGNIAGPIAGGVIDYKERREQGQSKARSAGGAFASGAGWAKGAQMGASLASKLPIPNPLAKAAVVGAGGLIGGYAGGEATSAAYDYAVNKTRPARQAISRATGYDEFAKRNQLMNRGVGLQKAQGTVGVRGARQVSTRLGSYGTNKGSALTGLGGPTTVNRQAGTLTSAGRTAKLSPTQLVRDPKTGRQVVGDLAYKGGKAVYLARPSIQSRDTSIAANIGRALNIGRYSKAAEAQSARQEYRTALRGTQQYQRQLGISPQRAKALKLPGR